MTDHTKTLKTLASRPFDKLIELFIQLREKKSAEQKKLEAVLKPIEEAMELLTLALQKKLTDNGQKSAPTEVGTAYLYPETTANIVDFDALWAFVRETDRPELLQKRLTITEVRAFMEAHPETPVPGVRVETSQTVRVKR